MESNQSSSDEMAQVFWQLLHQQMSQRPRLAPWLARYGRVLLERFTHCYQMLCWLPRWTRRRWQRKLGTSLAGMALALALNGVAAVQSAPLRQADAIVVTTNDPAINDGDDLCSLSEAIINANDDAATHIDCATGSGDDVITLAGSLYTLTSAYSPKNGLPSITSNLVIEGNGAIITSEPGQSYRILDVTSTGALTLNHTTVSGGEGIGGGIHNNGGQLTLNYSTVSSSGTESTNGGGIYNSGTATLNSSTVRNNIAWYGGGIYNDNGILLLRDSTLSGNASLLGWGGGIFNYLGTVTLENSTVSGNRVADGYDGGGIYNRDGILMLVNTTITNNQAGDRGGGLYNEERTRVPVITLINTIVANNAGGDCIRSGGEINALYSLIQDGLSCVNGVNTSNRTGDPLLGPLRDNGGPTFTHALLDNSPAIHGGHNEHIPDGIVHDQRGPDFPRIQGGTVDMGAVESAATDAPIVVTTNSPAINDGDGFCSLSEAIINANEDAATYADCAAGNGHDLIRLQAGDYTLTAAYAAGTGLPIITSSMEIEGNGATIRRNSGSGHYRILEVASTGDLTLSRATITGGDGYGSYTGGGGIYNAGVLTLTNSTIMGNHHEGGQGGGGGLYNVGKMTLLNSTVSGNRADLWHGGGIHNIGELSVINSTISANDAPGYDGGGIANNGVLTLTNSLIANNGGDSECWSAWWDRSLIHASHSLIESSLGCVNGININNLTGDPNLGPLQDNGGPTFTHALLAGSKAIDAGSNDALPPDTVYEQRGPGFPRILGNTVDLGAFEAESICPAFPWTVAHGAYLGYAITCFNQATVAGEYLINLSDDLTLDTPTPAIDNPNPAIRLRIEGYGHTVDGQYLSGVRPFTINPNTIVAMDAITITRGNANTLSDGGGGILNQGTLTLTASIIKDNWAVSARGGGIHNLQGIVTVIDSTVDGNHSLNGGGIRNHGGEMEVFNSTISNNIAERLGGGVYNETAAGGSLLMVNSTVSGNDVVQETGGGIINNGALTLVNSTVNNNHAPRTAGIGGIRTHNGTTTLINTISANNLNGDCVRTGGGTLHATHSLFGDDLSCVNGDNIENQQGDPKLGPLQDNGGPTFTHALQGGSLAINRGDDAACTDLLMTNSLDQRGITRPQGSHCDIGAFELVDMLAPTANPVVAPAANANGWHNSEFTVTWNWADGADGSGLDPASCVTSSTPSSEGEYPLNATCADLVGNQGSANYAVKLDLTKPTISATAASGPNAAGWYNSAVTVQFACVDALSGIPDDGCPADQVLTGEGTAVTSTVATVSDNAANSSEPSNVVTVQIDRAPPVVTVTGVSEGAVYEQDNVPAAGCDTQDGLSGVAALAMLSINGGDPDGTGRFTATCEGARDNADNVGSASVHYTVEASRELLGVCGGYNVYQTDSGYSASHPDNDTIWNGNILVGTAGQNNLIGTPDNDLILGLDGNDILNGKAGDDVICGGEGNDLIYGELGTDYLDGGNHNDVLNGGTGDFDVLIGGEGNDTLLDPDGVADLQGGPGNDQVNLSLRAGWRTPDGKAEFRERFAAGLGNDTVTLGILGADTFSVDITGDEWTDMTGEGTADTIRFAGRIDQANSYIRKFEGEVVIATSELPLITDETGYEYWIDEPVEEAPGEEEPPSQEEPGEEVPGEEEPPSQEEPGEEAPGEEEPPSQEEPGEEAPGEEEPPSQEEPGEEEPTPQPPITEPLEHQLYLPLVRR